MIPDYPKYHPPYWWEPEIDEDEVIESEINGGDEEDFDCGYVRGEGCSLAGTEECDFECPYRDVLYNRVDSSPVPPPEPEIDPIPF